MTNRGRMHAFKTGKALLHNGYAADICYTSPSLRCVQSADGILNGMSRKDVPMQLVSLDDEKFDQSTLIIHLGTGIIRMLFE